MQRPFRTVDRLTRGSRAAALLISGTLALGIAACQPAAEPVVEATPGERVENTDLGLALASVPVGFALERSDSEGIHLTSDSLETTGGKVSILAGPEESGGINLVAESQARIDHFTEVGTSFGSRELQGPIGAAFTVRGRRPGDTGEVEETWIYALHPISNRLVTLVYEYPPGEDTQARINHVLEVLGEVEGLATGASS